MQDPQEKGSSGSKVACREIQKCQLGPGVLNQSPNKALDWLLVSLLEQLISCSQGMLTLLLANSSKVLAHGSKRSLQLPCSADGLEFKLHLHRMVIQL